MTADSKPDRPYTAEDNQDQASEKPPGPKGSTLTYGSGDAPAGRGGAPAGPVKADPEPDQPSSGTGTKGAGTYKGEAGAGRG